MVAALLFILYLAILYLPPTTLGYKIIQDKSPVVLLAAIGLFCVGLLDMYIFFSKYSKKLGKKLQKNK